MNELKTAIQLAIAFRGVFESAAISAVFCSVAGALVAVDIYAIHTQLLPWETLWSSLTLIDQARTFFMFIMFGLSIWYTTGAIYTYPFGWRLK